MGSNKKPTKQFHTLVVVVIRQRKPLLLRRRENAPAHRRSDTNIHLILYSNTIMIFAWFGTQSLWKKIGGDKPLICCGKAWCSCHQLGNPSLRSGMTRTLSIQCLPDSDARFLENNALSELRMDHHEYHNFTVCHFFIASIKTSVCAIL